MPRLGALACFVLAAGGSAFVAPPLPAARCAGLRMGYVPDGLTAQQWQEIQQRDRAQFANKNLGAVGVTKFQSRSQKAWQESGAEHLFPVDLSTPEAERPYMMRKNGKWDNSDIRGASKRAWTAADRDYANGGEKKAQSVSVFGGGAPFASERLNWTGA